MYRLYGHGTDNGLLLWMYGPCEVNTQIKGININLYEETDYPFRENILLRVEPDEKISFPLYLRIPGWSKSFALKVNNEILLTQIKCGGYVRLERNWTKVDITQIDMGLETILHQWSRNGSITVDRGPLSYSIKIEEEWRTCGGTKQWPEWRFYLKRLGTMVYA